MLSINQKVSIFDSFTELTKKIGKDNVRFNYSFEQTKKQQKNVICQFNIKTGNGYVCGKYLDSKSQYNLDPRGWINIKNFNEKELKILIKESISSLSK